jgi:ankyrin repeat protein
MHQSELLNWAEAINNGCVDTCRQLIESGADVNGTVASWQNPPPLVLAAERGQYLISEMLLAAGADVHAKNIFGSTALHFATAARASKLTRLLLDHGADVNAPNEADSTPLHWAATNGNADVCRMLIEAGASVDAACVKTAGEEAGQLYTPLRYAVESSNIDACRVLLEFGADPSARSEFELSDEYVTPFLAAIKSGYDEIAQLLFDSGKVDPFMSTVTNVSVIELASTVAMAELVRAMQTEFEIRGNVAGVDADVRSRSRGLDIL